MVDDDVERLDIPVHDTVQVGVLECLEDHVGVQADVHVVKAAGQYFRLNIGNILENECWGLGARVTQDVIQFDDVGASIQRLEDLDLAILFLDADGLEDFDDTLLVVLEVGSLEDF